MILLRSCSVMCGALVLAACAGSSMTAEAPVCEPQATITVADPAPGTPLTITPEESELVSVRLFIISPGGGSDELPAPIETSPICKASGCDVVLAPALLGRNRSKLRFEQGSQNGEHFFSLEAFPTLAGEHVQLSMNASFFSDDGTLPPRRRSFEFKGTLEPGTLTHVGTFHGFDHRGHDVGPQVFAMAEPAS